MSIQNQKWIKFSEELPRPLSGYIVAVHPNHQRGRPQVVFVGSRPDDFLNDGYTLWYPIPKQYAYGED